MVDFFILQFVLRQWQHHEDNDGDDPSTGDDSSARAGIDAGVNVLKIFRMQRTYRVSVA